MKAPRVWPQAPPQMAVWLYELGDIPKGWALADGTNGTMAAQNMLYPFCIEGYNDRCIIQNVMGLPGVNWYGDHEHLLEDLQDEVERIKEWAQEMKRVS